MRNEISRQVPIPLQMILVCGLGLFLGLASTLLPSFLIIAAIAGILYLVIVWLWPEVALLCLIVLTATIFDENALPSIPIGVGHLLTSDFLLFIPLAVLLLRVWVEPGFSFNHTPLDLPLLAFYGTAVLSTVIAILHKTITFNQSLGELRAVNFYLAFFVVTNFVRDERRLRRLLNGLFVLTFIVALSMIAQYALGDVTKILPGRVETLFTAGTSDPGVTRILPPGQSLVLLVLITLPVLLIFNKVPSKFITRFFQLIIVALAVVLTFNRSFWVAFALSLSLVIIFVSMSDKIRFINISFWTVTAATLVMVPVLILSGNQAQELINGTITRLGTLVNPSTLNESSLQYRYVENQYALPQIAAHPFIGLGLGGDYRPWDRRIDFVLTSWDNFAYIHNGHFWVMLKTGLLGYLFFIWLLLRFMQRGLQNWMQIRSSFLKGIVLSFSVAMFGVLFAAIVDPIFAEPYWTVLLGIVMGVNEVIYKFNQAPSADFRLFE